MRRFALASILLGVVPVVAAGPAGAHTCSSPVAVEVGERAPIPVGVAAEQAAVTGVEISVPSDFRLLRVRPPAGWKATAEDSVVELRGGTIEPFGCATATLEGTATDGGELAFRITVSAVDGSTAETTQLAYARQVERGDEGGLARPGVLAGALGVVLGLTALVARRRARPSR